MTSAFTSWIRRLAAGAGLAAAVAAAMTSCSIRLGVVATGVNEIADAGRHVTVRIDRAAEPDDLPAIWPPDLDHPTISCC
jgi:hypothetical protein